MQTTQHHGYKVFEGTDSVAMSDFNSNVTAIDADVYAAEQALAAHKKAAILDHPDGSVTDAKIGTRELNDTLEAAAGLGTLTNLLGKIGYMLKTITGNGDWYTAPVTDLENVNETLSSIISMINALDGRKTSVVVLTGVVAHGGTIPLPADYTQAQCKWITSVDDRTVDDDDTIRCFTSAAVFDRTSIGRVATNWTDQRGGRQSNYIIIGVK